MNIKVMIVDDHLVVLRGLRFFLETQPNIDIVGQAYNGEEALQQIESLQPDVVLMDLQMPKMNGIVATKKIKETHPHIKVIILTSFSDQDSVLPAIKAGADGYQLKDIDPDILVETIQAAMNHDPMLHPQVTSQLISHVTTEDETKESEPFDSLTPREKEVLYQITLGKTNKEIAADLYITEKTVKTHITHLLSKLGVQDRTQAALYAMKNRFFE